MLLLLFEFQLKKPMTLFLLMVAISTKRVAELRHSSFFSVLWLVLCKRCWPAKQQHIVEWWDRADETEWIGWKELHFFWMQQLFSGGSVNGTRLKMKTLPEEKQQQKSKQPPASRVAHLSRIIHLFFSFIDAVRQNMDLDLLEIPFWLFFFSSWTITTAACIYGWLREMGWQTW